mmetsp:Transcript_23948/g.49815  ORF Transcript_23948/g.49815 Transcript_23948/m.49815 type:complete len:152 (+) Transcript_23948:56-511(+)
MAAAQTMMIEGREFQVWTEDQLSAINRDALKKRCMDLRDAVGADRLPSMPRHPEGMVSWILQVQSAVMRQGGGGGGGGGRGGPPAQYGGDDDYAERGASGGSRAAPPPRGGYDYEPSEASQPPSEAQQAYIDAKNAANAVRQRNSGSGGLW